MQRNPNWTEEEVVVALDLYAAIGAAVPSHPKIVQLSTLLRSIPSNRRFADNPSFRNTNGISLKLANLASLDPDYQGAGMKSVSAIDRAIWNRYGCSPKELMAEAKRIRQRWLAEISAENA